MEKVRCGQLGVILACVGTASTFAQIRVDYLENNAWINLAEFAPGSDVTVVDTGSRTYRVYAVSPTTQSIGTLRINSGAENTPVLFVGQGLTAPSEFQPLPTSGALDIRSVQYSGGRPQLQLRVHRHITGEIAFWHIRRLDAGGTIMGDIVHDPIGAEPPPRLGFIRASNIGTSTTNPVISAKRGDIFQIETIDDIYSNIECVNGSLTDYIKAGGILGSKFIRALNGSINDITALRYIGTGFGGIQPSTIQARNGIHLIKAGDPGADGFIRANIAANANGGSGSITRLEVIEAAAGGNFGHFLGSLTANRVIGEPFKDAVHIDGDLKGSISITGDLQQNIFVGGRFPSGTISVGGSVLGSALINIGAYGPGPRCMGGQIIINANNDSSIWSAASDVLFCGNLILSPIPWYANSSETLGGGAIGEAPFNVHAADCTPPHDSSQTMSTFQTPVVIRHYGPVFTLGSAPLQVFARQIGTIPWTEHTSDFTYAVSVTDNRRNITIEKKPTGSLGWHAGYEYRITPMTDVSNANALRCLDVVGKPTVRPYEHRFTIARPADDQR